MSFKSLSLALLVFITLAGCDKSDDVELPVLNADYSSNPDLKDILSSEKTTEVPAKGKPSPKPTPKAKTKPKKKKQKSKPKEKYAQPSTQSFTGGKIANGLDMHRIRASANAARTRLVFESYLWTNGRDVPSTQANNSGNYLFTYNSKTRTITALIDGYKGFTALKGAKIATLPAGSMIKEIKLLPYMDDSGYKFTISIKEEAQVKVFELKNPGRIVVDINKIY